MNCMRVTVEQIDSRMYKWNPRQIHLHCLLPVVAAVALFWFGEFSVVAAHGELISSIPAPAELKTSSW